MVKSTSRSRCAASSNSTARGGSSSSLSRNIRYGARAISMARLRGGAAPAAVLRQPDVADAMVLGGQLPGHLRGVVGRVVVADDDLDVRVRLGAQRGDRAGEAGRVVEDDDRDRDVGAGHAVASSGVGAGVRASRGSTGGSASSGSPRNTRRTTRSAARPSSYSQNRRRNAARALAAPSSRQAPETKISASSSWVRATWPGVFGHQVEVDAAGGPVRLPVVGVDHDRAVQVGVVEHDRRVVRDQRVGGQAEFLDGVVGGDVDDPAGAAQAGQRGGGAAVEVVGADGEDGVFAEAVGEGGEVEAGVKPAS